MVRCRSSEGGVEAVWRCRRRPRRGARVRAIACSRLEPSGPAVTESSEFAHTFFRSDRETHQMRLNDTDALRSVTTIYVLLIAASLGAMLVVHRGRRDDEDSGCDHGDGRGRCCSTIDQPPNEVLVGSNRIHVPDGVAGGRTSRRQDH